MATYSSILAWEIPWTEEPGGLQSMVSQESDMTQQLNHLHSAVTGYFPLVAKAAKMGKDLDGSISSKNGSVHGKH